MNVSIIDLKQRYIEERDDILSIIDKTLASGSLVMTPEINDFEKDICKFVNSKNCSTLNSGTDALMMALWAMGVKEGDEVKAGEAITVKPELWLVGTMNPNYSGTYQINEDMRSRFDFIEVPYMPAAMERKIMKTILNFYLLSLGCKKNY